MLAVRLACCAALSAAPVLGQIRAHRLDGLGNGDAFGRALAGGVDVDGDGTPDFLIGAPQDHPTATGNGYARLVSGRTGAPLLHVTGDALGDAFGFAVAFLGDVNQDGTPDFAVGAPRADRNGTDRGYVRVVSGSTGATLRTIEGGSANDEFGYALCAAGDADGDGRPDFAAGAPQELLGNGYVRVVSAHTGLVLLHVAGSGLGDRFGAALANAGDVDLDGRADLIAGAPWNDAAGANAGLAIVFAAHSGVVATTFLGPRPFAQFGQSADGLGDVDGDGWRELVLGVFHDDLGFPGLSPGSVEVRSGRTGTLLHRHEGITADDLMGRSVAGLGDADGDGVDDYAYSARHDIDDTHTGMVYVRSGASGALLLTLLGERIPDEYGVGLARAGDLDGDGLADVLVGALEAYHSNPREGYVTAFLGSRARIATSGESCPPIGAPSPRLLLGGDARAGGKVELEVARGTPGSIAFVRFSSAQLAWPDASFCSCVLGPPWPLVIPIPLTGAGTAAGSGRAIVILPPSVLPGVPFHAQAFVRAAGGFATSNPLEVVGP